MVFILELPNLIRISRTTFLADSAFSFSILILIIIIIIINETSLLFFFSAVIIMHEWKLLKWRRKVYNSSVD